MSRNAARSVEMPSAGDAPPPDATGDDGTGDDGATRAGQAPVGVFECALDVVLDGRRPGCVPEVSFPYEGLLRSVDGEEITVHRSFGLSDADRTRRRPERADTQ